MYRIRTLTLVIIAALTLGVLAPAAAPAVSRGDIIARGRVWLGAASADPKTGATLFGVPYSQGKWALEDGSPVPASSPSPSRAGYRTDCSGFVSMCWNLRDEMGNPYSTSTYEMGKNNSSRFMMIPINKADLLPGDVLLKSSVWYPKGTGHVIIFAGWSKADQSEYWALEQTSPRTKYSKRPYGQAGYRSFRFLGIDGFDTTRVLYGGAFTVSGAAMRSWAETEGLHSAIATDGVVDLAVYGSDGALSPLVADVSVVPNGYFSLSYAPTVNGKFAVRYRPSGTPDQGTVLIANDITVVPYVSPVNGGGSKLRRKSTAAFTGYVNPRTGSSLKVYKYNTKTRKYVYYQTVKATVSRGRTSKGFKFTTKWKPKLAGKYRINWMTAAPLGMAFNTSGFRYVTVN